MSEHTVPVFALIGLGQFGYEHYKELCKLEALGRLKLRTVFSQSGHTDKKIHHPILPVEQLYFDGTNGLDALIIATPAGSHFSLIEKFHDSCHMLVEKPLADSLELIRRCLELESESSKCIIPAHNYRFHPAVTHAKFIIDQIDTNVTSVEAAFINLDNRFNGGEPAQEMLHALDVVQFLLGKSVLASHRCDIERLAIIDCEYDNFLGRYQLGFGAAQSRLITIRFASHVVEIDFLHNIVSIEDLKNDIFVKKVFDDTPVSLFKQIEAFCEAIAKKPSSVMASVSDAYETFSTTVRSIPNEKLRVAVIGGGAFGCQCALEISSFAHVDIFERNDEILTEASFKNQWRHHSGFHYPLSFETVKEIKDCKEIFENDYREAIVSTVPSYYMVSNGAREIPAERYLASCNYYGLNFSIVPELSIVRDGSVSVTLLTDEALYDIPKLRQLMKRRIDETDAILHLNNNVVGGYIDGGNKKLIIEKNGIRREEEYDVVVNCAYSEFGDMSSLFKVDKKKVRLEYVEMLELKVDIDPICLTFIDAPFLSLTYMLEENRYFLSHRDHSVIERKYEHRIDPVRGGGFTSNRNNIIRDACRYMPFLKDAEYVKSWYCVKARSAYEKEFWEVPTIVKNHGFGYWSVLGGKILTCSKNAKDLSQEVRDHFGIKR